MARYLRIAASLIVFSSAQLLAQTTEVILEPLVTGLANPIFVTNARDGSARRFVVEQAGRILVLQPDSSTPSLFLDISAKVLSGGERGLLGLAFHPVFSENRRFFVNYTRQPDGATVIAQYTVPASNPNQADPSSEQVLLTIDQPFANHNGGMIQFGPDNFLYIGMGDGGSGNDPQNRAQNPEELLGKILRIDVDNPTSDSILYSSPASNPFFGATAGRDEIYATGFRNPYRFSFDRLTGQLYAGDVGQGSREEIDIVTLGGNFGWRIFEGTLCTGLGPDSCSTFASIPPVAEYNHEAGRCSVTGGYVYRGTQSSLPSGAYVFGDFCTGEIFMLNAGVQTLLADTDINISSFGEDEAGEIYVVGHGGTVSRIAGSRPVLVSERHFAVSDKGVTVIPAARTGESFATGYSWVLSETGESLPQSLAILASRKDGILIAEAAVPAVQPVRSGRILASISESTTTGIAIANLNDRNATIAFYFTDSSGRDSEIRRFRIPPGRQIAEFLDEDPFFGGTSFDGTFTFISSAPVWVMALSGRINERSEFLFTNLPVGSLTGSSASTTAIPYWTEGGNRNTKFALVNQSDQTISGEVRLLDPEGESLEVLPYSIPAKSSATLSPAITPAPPQIGSARIVPSDGPVPSAVALVQLLTAEGTVTETSISAIPSGTGFTGYGEESNTVLTNLAITNVSTSAATVQVELTPANGTGPVQTGTIQLAPSRQSFTSLAQVPGLSSLPIPFQGTVRILSSAPIAVTFLRTRINARGDLLVTEIPPAHESSPPSAQAVFPNIALGEGFEMQFVFINSQSAGDQTGRMLFLGQNGKRLPVSVEQEESGSCREERRSRWATPLRVCS